MYVSDFSVNVGVSPHNSKCFSCPDKTLGLVKDLERYAARLSGVNSLRGHDFLANAAAWKFFFRRKAFQIAWSMIARDLKM